MGFASLYPSYALGNCILRCITCIRTVIPTLPLTGWVIIDQVSAHRDAIRVQDAVDRDQMRHARIQFRRDPVEGVSFAHPLT